MSGPLMDVGGFPAKLLKDSVPVRSRNHRPQLTKCVIPAEAGIFQGLMEEDPGLRRGDVKKRGDYNGEENNRFY